MTRTPMVEPSLECLDVREARARGEVLSAALEAHVQSCPSCRAEPAEAELDLDSLFAEVSSDLAADTGPAGRLRSLPTPARLAAAAGFAAALVALVGILMPRTRFAPLPVERVVLVVTSLALLLALAVRTSLRPLQAHPVPSLVKAALVLGVLLPIAFALGPFGPPFAGIPGTTFFQAARSCFELGAVVGVLVVAVLYVLDRGEHRSRESALLAAAAGGLAANAALELHCPATDPAHLLLGHAGVAVALVLVYGLAVLRRER